MVRPGHILDRLDEVHGGAVPGNSVIQIDLHARRRTGVGNGVDAVATDQPVNARAADQKVVTPHAKEEVVAGSADHGVEAGAAIAHSIWSADLVDEVYWFQAPVLIGDGTPAIGPFGVNTLANAPRFPQYQLDRVGLDLLIHFKTR